MDMNLNAESMSLGYYSHVLQFFAKVLILYIFYIQHVMAHAQTKCRNNPEVSCVMINKVDFNLYIFHSNRYAS